MDSRAVLREQINAKATALGFDLVGITSAAPLEQGGRLRAWVAQGFAGEMGYMSRDIEKRLAPSRVFPEVRSIIVLGINYYTVPSKPETAPGCGWMARYAWGQDYHTVLGDKLKALVAFSENSTGLTSRHAGTLTPAPSLSVSSLGGLASGGPARTPT